MKTSPPPNPSAGQTVYESGGPRARLLLALLCLAFFFDYADRFILAALLPFIKQDWHLSDQALGTLTGILSVPMAILVIPLSLVIDRWSRRKMLALMVFLWSLATFACAFTRSHGQLLLARAFTGVGEAGYAPASIASIAAAFPQRSRARATGIWDAFAPLGAAVGFSVGGYIGLHYGWRHAFGLMALPGLFLAVAFLFIRDYRTVPLPIAEGETSRNLWASTRGLFGISSLVWTWVAFTCNFACTTPLMAWLPSYMNRFHGLDEQRAGMVAGLLALLALVGAPLGGILADLWIRRQPNARLYLSGVTSLLSALFLALALLLSQTILFTPLLILFGILSVAFLGPAAAIIQDVVHPGLRALAYGINVFFLQLLGSSWTPWFVGALSDRWDLEKALLLLPLFSVAAGIFFFLGVNHYQSDAGRVQDVVLLEES